jgi:CheY-like chemotaxis protein
VSWRLDLFTQVLGGLFEKASQPDGGGQILVGYRLRDDLVFMAVEPGSPSQLRTVVSEEYRRVLPGLRVLDIPHETTSPSRVQDRLFKTCDVVLRAHDAHEAVSHIRFALGMSDDRRTTLRLPVEVPLRYDTPGGWIDGFTRDLSARGIFVTTPGRLPAIGEFVTLDLFTFSAVPVRVRAAVMRHTDEGFGARLAPDPAAEQEIYVRLRRLRNTPFATEDPRVPAHLDAECRLGGSNVRATVANLSRGGALIHSDAPVEPGESLRIDISIPPRPNDPAAVEVATVEAEVTRTTAGHGSQANGFAVAFRSMDANARERLEHFIEATIQRRASRVLVSMADERERKALVAELSRAGCDVLSAKTAAETIDRIIDEILSLDLLVIDESVPGATAADLLHRIRRLGGESDLRIAVRVRSAAYGCSGLVEAGATAILTEPRTEDVAQSCLELLHRGADGIKQHEYPDHDLEPPTLLFARRPVAEVANPMGETPHLDGMVFAAAQP